MGVVKAPAFAWRCEWNDRTTSEEDGFTYAIEKGRLLQEVTRRQYQAGGVATKPEVVMVDWELTKLLISKPFNIYSTIKDRHPYDKGTFSERDHTDAIQGRRSFTFS
jgi:hypothetical protein